MTRKTSKFSKSRLLVFFTPPLKTHPLLWSVVFSGSVLLRSLSKKGHFSCRARSCTKSGFSVTGLSPSGFFPKNHFVHFFTCFLSFPSHLGQNPTRNDKEPFKTPKFTFFTHQICVLEAQKPFSYYFFFSILPIYSRVSSLRVSLGLTPGIN